ncbi:MAG: PEP-CTERM sorting domain-containing protein [Kiritimatiellales bacterium]
MKKIMQLVLLLAGVLGTGAHGADIYWTNNDGDQVWTNNANWAGLILPGVSDNARLNKTYSIRPVFSSGMDQTVNNVFLGMTGDVAGFEMTGGSLTTVGSFEVNKTDTAGHTSQFDMSGGTLAVGGNFRVGWNDNTADFNMTGGLVDTEYGNVGELGTVILSNGTIDVRWNWTMDAGALLDIYDGTLIVRNADAREAQIQGYIDAGNIVAYGGSGTINMVKEGGILTITAIPEPATISLVVFSAVGLILYRRKVLR